MSGTDYKKLKILLLSSNNNLEAHICALFTTDTVH